MQQISYENGGVLIFHRWESTCWHVQQYGLTNILKENVAQRKCKVPLYVLHLSVECLPVIKNSGIRKSRHLWPNPDMCNVPSSDSSCKQPRVSCAEEHVTVLLPVSGCQVSLHILNVKKGFALTSSHTVHWYAVRKRHLLHLHCGLCFKLRQLKLIGCKRLCGYRQL